MHYKATLAVIMTAKPPSPRGWGTAWTCCCSSPPRSCWCSPVIVSMPPSTSLVSDVLQEGGSSEFPMIWGLILTILAFLLRSRSSFSFLFPNPFFQRMNSSVHLVFPYYYILITWAMMFTKSVVSPHCRLQILSISKFSPPLPTQLLFICASLKPRVCSWVRHSPCPPWSRRLQAREKIETT